MAVTYGSAQISRYALPFPMKLMHYIYKSCNCNLYSIPCHECLQQIKTPLLLDNFPEQLRIVQILAPL